MRGSLTITLDQSYEQMRSLLQRYVPDAVLMGWDTNPLNWRQLTLYYSLDGRDGCATVSASI